MIPHSDAMRAEVERTHSPRYTVTVTDLETGVDVVAPILSGTVRKEGASWPRSTLSIEVPTGLLPAEPSDYLLPFGTEYRVEYSVGGLDERIPIAVGVVTRSTLTRPGSTWSIEGADHSARVDVDEFRADTSTPNPDFTVAAWIRKTIERTVGPIPDPRWLASGPALTETLAEGFDVGGSAWASIEGAAESAECEVWQGVAVEGGDVVPTWIVRPIPDVSTPVDRLESGAHLVGYTVSHERAFNRVVVQYTHPETDARTFGVWQENRPGSPLAVDKIGRVAYPTLTRSGQPSEARADRAARAIAKKVAGRARSVEVQFVARPWLEPGDSVEVVLANDHEETFVLGAVSIPLGPEAMTANLRDNRYRSGGPIYADDA